MGVVPTRTLDAGSVVSRVELRGLTFHRPFVFVTKREKPLSPATEAFVATCIGEGNA